MIRASACLLACAVVLAACELPAVGDRASARPVVGSDVPATPRPTSSQTLPRADETRVVSDALTRAGARVDRALPSKFDWLFGSAAPRAATFEVTLDGQPTWADVHVIERTLAKLVACSGQPMTSTAGTFNVATDGRRQVLGNSSVTGSFSSGTMYFAASDRYFVMTPDLRLRDSLARELALSVPSCREPVDLAVLPWEQDIADAVRASGGEMELVAGSKLETFLGDRREARFFRWNIGTHSGGADVIRLDPPAFVAMCAAPLASAPAFTKWTVRVDGTVRPGLEGSGSVFPLVGMKFFALAFDAESAAVLSGLGLTLPPC